MGLLCFDTSRAIGRLKEDFRRETGLKLHLNHECITDDMELWKLISDAQLDKYKPHNKYRVYPDIIERLRHTWELYRFSEDDEIGRIRQEILNRFGLNVIISDENEREVDEDVIVGNARPKSCAQPKPDYERLIRLNDLLIGIEKDIHAQWELCTKVMTPRMNNEDDWLMDYEMIVELSFILDERDHLYCEDSDNIILKTNEIVFKDGWDDWGIDDNEDHTCERPLPGNDKLRQCWLYHDLYDHQDIAFEDIHRIGKVWMEFSVVHQHDYSLREQ